MAETSQSTQEPAAVLEAPEEVLSTMHKDGRRRWLYPVLSRGAHYRRRSVVGWALVVLYLVLPIVPIGGKPAILLDVLHSQFTFFGTTFYATDTLLLMLFLLLIFGMIIALTALLGRAWCGWACPQTVYMEFVFRPIERLFEGNENKRNRQDHREMTVELAARKVGKHAVYLLIATVLAHTFVAYFVGWSKLLTWMTGPPREHWGFFLMMGLTTALVLADFTWFREQMCTLACPYARIQSVLMDRDSLIVSYDAGRGEPRAKPARTSKKSQPSPSAKDILNLSGPGDCIDCGACVRTCPTGIDIRDGLQMECIGCTQCIDACDAIMDKIQKPRGLVRYTSENTLQNTNPRVLRRPRLLLYAAVLLITGSLFVYNLSSRERVEINITRVPGEPFAVLPDGTITNRVRFRVHNRTGVESTFHISALEPPHTQLKIIGPGTIKLANGDQTHLDIWVVVPVEAFQHGEALGKFSVKTIDGTAQNTTFRLLGPKP